ncbi:hypothetical protein D5086_018370 [Populus alba]|uniref:Uncharacterized protein n=1 Tax=Populus alba TaxID=43335 RepID=A0ACC4BPK4_POPAL
MFGGGSVYWGRKESESKGIVVIFAWISIHEKHLNSHLDLYSSLGWNSLVSHADFLSAFYPERALSLAYILLNELVEDLRVRPCPVIFVAFSGGSKACMYKVLQIIQGTCEGHLNMDECRLVKNCISGHIYDSSPIDFTSDLAAQFSLHPAIQRMSGPSKFMSWVAKGLASGLDGLYLTRFELQRAEYWQTLYSSIDMGAPYLILCSENDDLAPYVVISKFVHRLKDLGGDVKLVKLNHSPHIGAQIQLIWALTLIGPRVSVSGFLYKAGANRVNTVVISSNLKVGAYRFTVYSWVNDHSYHFPSTRSANNASVPFAACLLHVKAKMIPSSDVSGHYQHNPIQYRAAVTNLLDKAPSVYYRRIQQLREGIGLDSMHDEMSELICDLQKAAVNSNQSFRRVAVGPGDHFFVPSSAEYCNSRKPESLQDERKERSIYPSSPPSISAHSVLGQVLFDACVPKNIEGWDVRFSGSLNGQPIASAQRRRSPFHGIKFTRRSRL